MVTLVGKLNFTKINNVWIEFGVICRQQQCFNEEMFNQYCIKTL